MTREHAALLYRVRLVVLVTILVVVVLYAIHDIHSRRARNDWDHTLSIAVVLLHDRPIGDDGVDAFRGRARAVEARLAEELGRYRPAAPRPFLFSIYGPVAITKRPPRPASNGLLDLTKHAWASWRYTQGIDAKAGVDEHAFDARIYVVVRDADESAPAMVEGESEEGGRVGTVDVDLDRAMADFAWIVVSHELFHILGASDEYDVMGRTLVPGGLAEPDAVPRYPQRFVEIMARNRPMSPREEVAPGSIDELAVGPVTAREIGWSRPAIVGAGPK